jgi:hypothetical protein
MTDEVFMARLHGYLYAVQRGGYGDGPVPDDFEPIIPYFKNADGTINRERTLEDTGITGVERRNLLVTP